MSEEEQKRDWGEYVIYWIMLILVLGTMRGGCAWLDNNHKHTKAYYDCVYSFQEYLLSGGDDYWRVEEINDYELYKAYEEAERRCHNKLSEEQAHIPEN